MTTWRTFDSKEALLTFLRTHGGGVVDWGNLRALANGPADPEAVARTEARAAWEAMGTKPVWRQFDSKADLDAFTARHMQNTVDWKNLRAIGHFPVGHDERGRPLVCKGRPPQ